MRKNHLDQHKQKQKQNSPHLEMFDGEIEADESYFGGDRKGKRGF